MSEHRTDEEKTAVAMAQLDGLADLWWAQSGYPAMDLPERFVKMVKQSYAEGLYNGRQSAIDEPPKEVRRRIEQLEQVLRSLLDDKHITYGVRAGTARAVLLQPSV